jgi:hypothetical protein
MAGTRLGQAPSDRGWVEVPAPDTAAPTFEDPDLARRTWGVNFATGPLRSLKAGEAY